MSSIGETLRGERLRRGLQLDQVACETRIRSHYLESMEGDEFERLPQGFLRSSFLRQYARTLGLDEEELVALYRLRFGPPVAVELPQPQPIPRFRPFPGWPVLGWLVLAIVTCVAGSRLWNSSRQALLQAPPEPEAEALVAPLPQPVPAPPAQVEATPPSVAAPALRVTFKANEPVWLSVKADEVDAYQGTLAGQESKEIDASSKVTVLIGNAGGLEIAVNGKPLGSLGAPGQVRLLELTPEGVKAIPRPPARHVQLMDDSGGADYGTNPIPKTDTIDRRVPIP